MEEQPREGRGDEDATGVSSDLQRLFEASSFGSPQAQEAYTQPPRHLVSDIVEQVRTVTVQLNRRRPDLSDGRQRLKALRTLGEEWFAALPMSSAGKTITPTGIHDRAHLSEAWTVTAARAATPRCGVAFEPVESLTTPPSGCLSVGADGPGGRGAPAEVGSRIGQHAFELAREYLATGKLEVAQHWLTIAVEYGNQNAQTLLADVRIIQESVNNPDSVGTTTGTAPGGGGPTIIGLQRQQDLVGQFHETAGLLHQARERAQEIIRKAHSTADEILAEARTEATAASRSSSGNPTDPFIMSLGQLKLVDRRRTRTTPVVVSGDSWRDSQDSLLATVSALAAHDPSKPSTGRDHPLEIFSPSIDIVVPPTRHRNLIVLLACRLLQDGKPPAIKAAADLLANMDPTQLSEGGARFVSTSSNLWTPALATQADDPVPEQRAEREQIVAGPKLRQALNDLISTSHF